MTVCVAAMCEVNQIVGASDRMLTAGDIQFEPQQSKIIPLTSSIALMMAGDSALQSEIIQDVQREIRGHLARQPNQWLDVSFVADLYARYYNRARFKRAENQILAPLGLTGDSFIARQNEMNQQFIRQLATELIGVDVPAVAAIIAGVDETGSHIYMSDGGAPVCQDTVGFAAIGYGENHANSQFMFAGHTRRAAFPKTLLLSYSAKKRAEVAPGVGSATDMFAMGPGLGSYIEVGDHVIENLERIYQQGIAAERQRTAANEQEITQYVAQITQQTNAATAAGGQEVEEAAAATGPTGPTADDPTVRRNANQSTATGPTGPTNN